MISEQTQIDKKTTENKKEKVVKIIKSVIDKVGQNQQISLNSVMMQLRDVLIVMEEMRHEVRTLSPQEIKGKHIAGATDELDAIVESTSEATSTIMDCCEKIQDKAAGGEEADAINKEVMNIYEACSFQDITGQRVSKVVKTFNDYMFDVSLNAILSARRYIRPDRPLHLFGAGLPQYFPPPRLFLS